MSRTRKDSLQARSSRTSRERHISIRAVRRDPPDLKKLSRALIQLAMAQAEAEAQAGSRADITNTEHDTRPPTESVEAGE
jgi:hypothetical protein